jgi:hypothetical protein
MDLRLAIKTPFQQGAIVLLSEAVNRITAILKAEKDISAFYQAIFA